MKKIDITVKVTYEVSICAEVDDSVADALGYAQDNYTALTSDIGCEDYQADKAFDWIVENCKEGDAYDWEVEIQDFDEED